MKKVLLFAIAISLGSIAFAGKWNPQPLDQATCDFFGHPRWHNRSVKGCLTCPVRENGRMVTCESVVAANGGVINKDCCWLNTPKDERGGKFGGYNNLDPILGNCYTNACVLGPNPWSVKCVCLLNCKMNPGPDCEQGCNNIVPSPNPANNATCGSVGRSGGNVGVEGGAGNAKVTTKGLKKTTVNKYVGPAVTPSKPVSVKQAPVQPSSKETAK